MLVWHPVLQTADVYSWGACNSTTGGCNEDAIAAGIEASMFADVDVINMSLGGPQHNGIANAVAAAWNAGIVLVAAAGNNQGNTIQWPAGYNQVIGVSGVQNNGTFADTSPCSGASSNWGEHVDISGPFWALSTVETSAYENENQGWCGTSMATPHVSGAAALLRAQNPTWSNQQIVDQLLNTADHPTSSTRDDFYGHGILDVVAALGGPAFEVTSSGPGSLKTNELGTWTANVDNPDGSVSYQWYFTDNSTSGWIPDGTNSNTYSRSFSDPSQDPIENGVRVVVTDNSGQVEDILYVTVLQEDCTDPTLPCSN
ncbi:hypothetical protein BH23BAC3_BH23BAC3_32900 [soil metagenome]